MYALVTLDADRGLVLPVEPSLGRSRSGDASFREATDRALFLARSSLSVERLPALRVACEELLDVHGPSIGLAAALAFVGYYLDRPPLDGAVLATGALDARGRVLPVSGMETKVHAAKLERGAGLVLVPSGAAVHAALPLVEVATLSDAIARVFGEGPWIAANRFRDFEAIRASMRSLSDAEAIDGLSALLECAPFEGDRMRVRVDLAARFRHLGRSARAWELANESSLALGALGRSSFGMDVAEQVELHFYLGRMDLFDLDATIDALRQRVGTGFSTVANEIRFRGALAQALGMAGRLEEAIVERRHNLPLHARSSDAARDRAGTHVYLALDSARIGDEAAFRSHVTAMLGATRAGDEIQLRYDAAAYARGLVALGRFAEAIAWFERRDASSDLPVPAELERAIAHGETVGSHPEVGIVRALVRALGRVGRPEDALELADRVVVPPEAGLVGFLGHLVRLEAAVVEGTMGRTGDLHRHAAAARAGLRGSHEEASRYHAALFDSEGPALEAAIDAVWY